MEERKGGRGRARGQARGPPAPQARPPAPQPGPAPGPSGWPQGPPHHRQQQATVPQASGWARPPANVQPSSSRGRGAREPQPGPSGDDGMQVEKRFRSEGPGEQSLAPRQGGNGGVRGARRDRFATVASRPKDLPTKQGTTGNRVRLISNFFELRSSGKWALHQYRVDFAPNIEQTPYRKRLARTGLVDKIPGYLFDGTVLYSPARLNPDPLEVFVKDDQDQNIQISIRRVGEIDWGDPHYLQVFNIIVRKCLASMKLELIGRNYFDPSAKISVAEHKLELWPGYSTSMRQHERSIMLNAEVQFKVLRIDNVFDLLMECRSGNIKREFSEKIIGCIVLTNYNNKTYRIDDVEWNMSPQDTFAYGNEGMQISFMDYMFKKYNLRVSVAKQPLLVSRAKPREIRAGMAETIYLIPECCQLTGLTDQQRKNMQLMRSLAEHTRVGPANRVNKLMQFSQRLTSNREVMSELKRWDLNLANSLVQIQGRELPEQVICVGKGRELKNHQGDWNTLLRNVEMISVAKTNLIAVICPIRFMRGAESFIQLLKRVSGGLGFDMRNIRLCEMRDDRINTYAQILNQTIDNLNPTAVIVVVPNDSHDKYAMIKKICSVDKGIASQVIVGRNLDGKGAMTIATKVVIQINAKIGGAPWSTKMPLPSAMFVGYDVCRDTANKGKSFGAMVASLDRNMTRYFSQTYEHANEEELSSNFAAFLILACNKYKDLNGNYPQYIFIYRDGVGDGQLPYVYAQEVDYLRKRLESEIYKAGNLMWAYIVVSKRINTRIFKEGGRGADNPACGTVVDDIITLPERYDFFLVSQCVRQGTVAPTNYNILQDTTGLGADKMQILTYKLTHLYYNWSGTVRVPAPCQYAHKYAFLTAQTLHRPANRHLENVLHFL